ncbi:uncharacterized protein CcaverHIS019_0106950 [Cutaneotrichosporon cavernicola]|uniref:Uncharacterized protein n=1 Tax=Cutaneotrichosporon cavernicola TaxID=279322 RepID=A0AA48I872_9TREE|nr:uncharacterized protein CcaverHIS019_0106950 [Cutaneotrichosporon cavernicola]BEI87977.1 hypothetical protein CcaverHIS019_0106950 [Cutaneotrichosporon cavernicola]
MLPPVPIHRRQAPKGVRARGWQAAAVRDHLVGKLNKAEEGLVSPLPLSTRDLVYMFEGYLNNGCTAARVEILRYRAMAVRMQMPKLGTLPPSLQLPKAIRTHLQVMDEVIRRAENKVIEGA